MTACDIQSSVYPYRPAGVYFPNRTEIKSHAWQECLPAEKFEYIDVPFRLEGNLADACRKVVQNSIVD